MGHWQVEVITQPCALPALIFEAGDRRVEVGGITVDRDIQHIVALIENFLNALAVVHVGVEHDDAGVASFKMLSSNGGIVEKAEASCGIDARVVARGAR